MYTLLLTHRKSRMNEWINTFYSANEGIDMDMSYKKYKLNELQ